MVSNFSFGEYRTRLVLGAFILTVFQQVVVCRVYRQAGSDTYDNDAALLEIDFHYIIDKLGEDEVH